jgi:hypothetical protein
MNENCVKKFTTSVSSIYVVTVTFVVELPEVIEEKNLKKVRGKDFNREKSPTSGCACAHLREPSNR